MAALQDEPGKAHAHGPISLLHKQFKPIGACSGYSIASLFLPVMRVGAETNIFVSKVQGIHLQPYQYGTDSFLCGLE
jgi:hypothetical protein